VSVSKWWIPGCLVLGLVLVSPKFARADVVDEAYAAGSEAALTGNWDVAIEHWQRALELLPGRSAQLDYDLGTAYASLGELGRATYHLERALQPEARPSVEVAEAARRNLGIVRRQAETQAEIREARISRPPTWWDLAIEVLAGRALAWISLISGWLMVGVVAYRQWRRRGRPAPPRAASAQNQAAEPLGGVSGALALVFALLFAIGGGLHALAIGARDDHPDAIALDAIVEVREGPGTHLPVAFELQGGSHVRVLDERAGWARVRLPGGLEGWAKAGAVARLDQSKAVGREASTER
jgi:tetratricopeptide (TPR) repeat protein